MLYLSVKILASPGRRNSISGLQTTLLAHYVSIFITRVRKIQIY